MSHDATLTVLILAMGVIVLIPTILASIGGN
jgi:hypothetical protein